MTDQRRPNPAQEFAITQIDSNIAVTAGAGSGKTTVLVGRYLRLLEAGLPVSQLVAITFTRKAAAEMSARLRSDLEKRLKTTTDPRHKKLLTVALQDMNAARISTIHSLCGDVVRANAAACGVDPSFVVLDEVQGKLLFNSARDRVLRVLGANPAADSDSQAAVRVIYDYGLRAVKDAFSAELFAQAATSLAQPHTVESILAAWLDGWRAAMSEAIARLLALPESQDLLSLNPPAQDGMGEAALMVKHALHTLSGGDSSLWMDALLTISKAKINSGSVKNWNDYPLTKDEAKARIALVRGVVSDDILKAIGTLPDDEQHRAAAEMVMGWRVIAARIAEAYTAAKRRKNALDFNDLELLAARALSDETVAVRYRAQFAHLMVDEFQDTSAAQWDIIRRLAPPDQPGRLFIVGDPKQSIYGFRGSDHTVFLSATAAIRASGLLQGKTESTAVSLSTSYRTHKNLLDPMNTLFDKVMSPVEGENPAGYVPFEALDAGRTDSPDLAPFFRVRMFDTDQPVIHGVEKWGADEIRPQEAADLADQIQQLTSAGLRYSDIAILCRAGTHFGLFEDALRARSIPYITTAGRGYFNRSEVTDLMSLLTALYNPGDHLALAAALHSPLFSLSDAALYALRLTNPSLWEAVTDETPPADFPTDELPALAFARRVLVGLKKRTRRTRVADILREVLESTGYLAFLESRAGGTQRRANVQKLVEQAETSGVVALSSFLTYVDEVKSAEARESDAALDAENAVQLMTIHASKGLEFKVVFLPMTNDAKNNDTDVLKLHPTLGLACKLPNQDGESFKPFPFLAAHALKRSKEDAEALRLFYVAATRAKDLLVLSGAYKRKDGESSGQGRMGHLLSEFGALMSAHPDAVRYEDITARVLPRSIQETTGRSLPLADASVQPVMPPLFQPMHSRAIDRVKHVTTTDLSHLSQSRNAPTLEERKWAEGRFRRGVLGQSDSPIRFLTAGVQSNRAPSRVVGEVVHEAIRFGYDTEAEDELRVLLQSLVWSQPIGPDLHADAVARALDLIQRYRRSALCHDIEQSKAVYREIPFVYQLDSTIIHGQIDLLYRGVDGVWALVDYKTDYVKRQGAGGYTEADLRDHSQRHLIQLAVYARAVRERLRLTDGQPLRVKLHYIAANATHTLDNLELESALTGQLPAFVQAALTGGQDA